MSEDQIRVFCSPSWAGKAFPLSTEQGGCIPFRLAFVAPLLTLSGSVPKSHAGATRLCSLECDMSLLPEQHAGAITSMRNVKALERWNN